eukprot:977776-Rhodomonas_salina.1
MDWRVTFRETGASARRQHPRLPVPLPPHRTRRWSAPFAPQNLRHDSTISVQFVPETRNFLFRSMSFNVLVPAFVEAMLPIMAIRLTVMAANAHRHRDPLDHQVHLGARQCHGWLHRRQ